MKHRRPTRTVRTARRVAAIGAIGTLTLTLGAGTATAGTDDERCENPDAVVNACVNDKVVEVGDVDLNVLGDEDEGFPPVHLGP